MKYLTGFIIFLLLVACRKDAVDSLSLQIPSNSTIGTQGIANYTHHAQAALDEYWFNDCTGEWMHLTGTVVGNSHLVQNGSKWILVGELQYLNVQGVGETTGKIYRFVGHSAAHEYNNFTFEYPWIKTYTANSLFVWRSRDETFWWRVSLKVITDATGELVIKHDTSYFECQFK